MTHKTRTKLDPKKKYLQVALNSTLFEARHIINQLPASDRIIVEAGTPLIKRYGEEGIRKIRNWYGSRIGLGNTTEKPSLAEIFSHLSKKETWQNPEIKLRTVPYIVADLKTMDRGETEIDIASSGGASAAIALGSAPIETLNSFIDSCEERGLDSMIDMMNVEFPLTVLRALKRPPAVVILHRGVDEEKFNKEKQIPLYEIRRIKANYDIMISIAGGDTIKEVQSAIFNDADIVVIWKSVFQSTKDTARLVEEFLKEIK